MRLIDADELMRKYHRTTVWDSWLEINNAPTVDAVPVVRCKDCKYWDYGDCYRLELSRPDDFCSYGERRGELKEAK